MNGKLQLSIVLGWLRFEQNEKITRVELYPRALTFLLLDIILNTLNA